MKPDPNHDGIIYQDMTDPALSELRRKTTSCEYDREVLKQFRSFIGRMGDYDLGTNDCRDIADRIYSDPFENDPISTCRPYYLPGDPRPGDKYKHLLPLKGTNKPGSTLSPEGEKALVDYLKGMCSPPAVKPPCDKSKTTTPQRPTQSDGGR